MKNSINENLNDNTNDGIVDEGKEKIKESSSGGDCFFESVLESLSVFPDMSFDCCLAEAASGIDVPECFVATASLEEASQKEYKVDNHQHNHPDLTSLRAFRDQILAHSKGGRLFIRIYYRWGQFGAVQIRKHPKSKFWVRNLLVKPMAKLSRWKTGV